MHWIKIVASLILAGIAAAQSVAEQPAKIRAIENWPVLPKGETLGQVTGIAVDSHNHVFVFHRAGRTWTEPFPKEAIAKPTIFMIDGDSGKLLARWGADRFIMPHGLSVDAENNIWVTDVGLEQLFKFSHDGDLLQTLGTPDEAGNDGQHFGKPADIAITGDRIFVADGYDNTRVAVFSGSGIFSTALGKAGTGPGEVDVPHGIAVHSGRVYLADRENSRLQIWSETGEVRGIWPRELVGRPYEVDVRADGLVAIIDGGDQPDATRATVRLFNAAGKNLGSFDTRRPDDVRNLGHDIAFGRGGAIYVGDAWASRVTKLVVDR